MTHWTWEWISWILLFLVIEGKAIANKEPGDTLSEHVWRWFSIKEKGKWWRLRRLGLLGFLAWLTLHFLTGGQF